MDEFEDLGHPVFDADNHYYEALPFPLDYVRELKGFAPEQRRMILNDNVRELITLRPR